MEGMRHSTVAPQIMKIVRMVVKFHPLLTVTSLVFGVIFLQYWIEEEVSNQWKILKVYCQSTMRAMLDPVIEKMKNLSKALQMHLHNEAAKGQLKAKLIGKVALFSATFLLLDTESSLKYDKSGAKTQLLLFIGLDLLIFSKLWSQLRILHGRCNCVANSTSNFTFFILAIVFAKFYDNSLRSLSVMLCIAVFLLCLLVVLQPRTDLGLFSFIIGVIGSITYNCFKFTSPMWIIASICFVLLCFKSWLDEYWLDLEQDQSLNSTNTTVGSTSVNVLFILARTFAHIALANFSFYVVKSPLSNYKDYLARGIGTVIWSVRVVLRLYPNNRSLPLSTNSKRITNLDLTIVNVAQGLFAFALNVSHMADYKACLLAIISFVVFCFWLRRFLPKDLSPAFTNTKGITGLILSLQYVATYGIVVLAGWEPRLYYKDWLVMVICYVLWWIRLRRSFSKNSLLSPTTEFKAPQWWTVVVYTIVSDVTSWIQLSQTRYLQQEG